MREVLFRGKNVHTGEWIYGSLIDLDRESGYVYIMEPYTGASTLSLHDLIRLRSRLVDPETVGQWTGLFDENVTKIFEGDVVNYKHIFRFFSTDDLYEHAKESPRCAYKIDKEVVRFVDGEFTPRPRRYDCYDYYYSHADFDFEVVGNIHDNPELVEVENAEV